MIKTIEQLASKLISININIMNVPQITEVKSLLEELKSKGEISEWELPYENLLTRLNAAIFFFGIAESGSLETIEKSFGSYVEFSYRENEEKKLSQLSYRLTFNEEEKAKNEALKAELVS